MNFVLAEFTVLASVAAGYFIAGKRPATFPSNEEDVPLQEQLRQGDRPSCDPKLVRMHTAK